VDLEVLNGEGTCLNEKRICNKKLCIFLGEQRIRADKKDTWVWKDEETTVYTVKSAYKMLKEEVQVDDKDLFVVFWRIKAQPTSHITAWRVLNDIIASKANLVRRG